MNASDNAIETEQSQALAVLFLSIASSNGTTGGLQMIAAQRERGSQKAAFLDARVIHEFIEIGVAATDYCNRQGKHSLGVTVASARVFGWFVESCWGVRGFVSVV